MLNVRIVPLCRCVASTALVCALALAAPTIASAHDAALTTTAAGHAAEDNAVVPDGMAAQQLTNQTVQKSTAPSAAAAATVSTDPGQSGQWGPLENWPVVAIGAALLPNGEVLAHDAVGDHSYTTYVDHTYTRATVWDPVADAFTPDWVTGYDIFCSGLAHLSNGTLFFAGGNADPNSDGIFATHTFDYVTNIWTRGADMTYARWYPTVSDMADGEMVITGGRPWIPEVRATDGSIRALSSQTGSMDLPLYPWMDVAPDGRLFDSGPDDMLRALDPTGGGTWQTFGPRGDGITRDYGSHVLYDIGKILVAGGGPSTPSALTININGSTPVVQPTSPMSFGRRQFDLTVLADGTVLATGGNSTGAQFIDMNGGVYNAERWDPATGNWTTLAAEQVTRQYHSTALLLPDGRVLSAGGGICNDCDTVGYLAKNAQIFSPPYLFKHDGSGQLAPRPQITGAPGFVSYGGSMPITTPNAASIQKVGLVKMGAVTHDNNMDQRYVPLSFTAGSGQVTASIPPNANLAPPGYYMLFIVDASGVPSVARTVWVGSTTPPPPPPSPDKPPSVTLSAPLDGASFTAPATVNISATASDPDGTVAKVEFFATQPGSLGSTIKLGEDATAPYNFTWSGVPAGTYALTARVTDDRGVTSTTPGRTTITVSGAANQPPTVAITSPTNCPCSYPFKPTITLSATASDPDGSVTKVDFLDGTTVLATDTTSPYSFTWKNVTSGSHTVSARATDNAGATTTSSQVSITVAKQH
jgi:hypothetical protein